jgi:hyperosmotically inducible periplasmic protein
MKTLLVGILLGVLLGAGAFWFLIGGRTAPEVQKAEEALAARLEALELRSEDIQKELADKGRVVRRKARDLGETAADVARDARTTALIKAKLAADPGLSALTISVSTTDGRVTLAGRVASPDLIGRATALALETEGVREVVSTLQVK